MGKPSVAWYYLMLCHVLGNSHTLFIIMCWLLIVAISCHIGVNIGGALGSGTIGILYNPVTESLQPSWIGCYVMTLLPFCNQKLLLRLV